MKKKQPKVLTNLQYIKKNFPANIAKRIIKNAKECKTTREDFLTDTKLEIGNRTKSSVLSSVFVWAYSPEGSEFWINYFDKL